MFQHGKDVNNFALASPAGAAADATRRRQHRRVEGHREVPSRHPQEVHVDCLGDGDAIGFLHDDDRGANGAAQGCRHAKLKVLCQQGASP